MLELFRHDPRRLCRPPERPVSDAAQRQMCETAAQVLSTPLIVNSDMQMSRRLRPSRPTGVSRVISTSSNQARRTRTNPSLGSERDEEAQADENNDWQHHRKDPEHEAQHC